MIYVNRMLLSDTQKYKEYLYKDNCDDYECIDDPCGKFFHGFIKKGAFHEELNENYPTNIVNGIVPLMKKDFFNLFDSEKTSFYKIYKISQYTNQFVGRVYTAFLYTKFLVDNYNFKSIYYSGLGPCVLPICFVYYERDTLLKMENENFWFDKYGYPFFNFRNINDLSLMSFLWNNYISKIEHRKKPKTNDYGYWSNKISFINNQFYFRDNKNHLVDCKHIVLEECDKLDFLGIYLWFKFAEIEVPEDFTKEKFINEFNIKEV
ncbi:MAG: hypothetical protein HUJ68_10860 [Clostridia bacterium]|nr:hypothetical protein [Clostridia bacterium]